MCAGWCYHATYCTQDANRTPPTAHDCLRTAALAVFSERIGVGYAPAMPDVVSNALTIPPSGGQYPKMLKTTPIFLLFFVAIIVVAAGS